MAQSGFTPISLYYSSTGAAVPSAGNLVAGELALNTNDGNLYYKNSSGVVTLLAGATSGPAGGSTTQVQYNNAGVLAGITGATTNGTAMTLVAPVLGTPASGTVTNLTGTASININGTVGATTPAAGTFNALTVSSTQGTQTITSTTAAQASYLLLRNTADSSNSYVYVPNKQLGIVQADTSGSSVVYFSTQNIERMRIDSSGNVGIGTNAPGYKLEVKGASATAGQLSIHDGTGDTTVSGVTAASLLFQVRDTSIRTLAEIDAVNTTTNGTGGAMVFQTRISDTLAERMRIDASGNVGIGTTSPANKLDLQSPSATALCFHGLQSGVVEWQIGFKASDSNLYVGTGSTLGGAGLYQTNTGTSWISVSDERLKKDITPLDTTKGLAGLLKLNPSTFHWKSEDAQQDLQIGLIAQNVQESFPELVSLGPVSEAAPDGAIGVNYTGFIAPMIKAIQELKAIIDTQATRIAALEAK
jgi:hypothetical protein